MKPTALATAVALSLALAACAASPGSGGNDVIAALVDARANPEKRLMAEAACERSFSRRDRQFQLQAFSAGLLNVGEASGIRTFCAGIVEAVIAGDLTEDDIAAFQRPKQIRGKAPLGTLLRAVLEAHERLAAQQAQRPPMAQSCGCGQ